MRGTRPSRTAQYVAQVRAVLHRRGIVDDPYAAGMLTRPNRAVVAALVVPPGRRLTDSPFFAALAARTAFFDQQVLDAIDAGIDQVVTVGAGYDSRAWRFARAGVTHFEVDHPATQADKRRRAPAGGPVYVAADLTSESVHDALARSRYEPSRRALFVIEGVTMYLTAAAVRSLLAHLVANAAPGSRLAVNFAAPPAAGSLVDRARQRALRVLGAAGGERHRFFLHADDTAGFVAATGWQVRDAVTLRDVARREFGSTALKVDRLHSAAGAVAAVAPGVPGSRDSRAGVRPGVGEH